MSAKEPIQVRESSINILAEGTKIEGKLLVEKVCRVHGKVVGGIDAAEGSTLVLAENALVEGDIRSDALFIDGFVRGNIFSKGKVVISGTGRVIGNIECPKLQIDFGGYFEGKCKME